MNVRDLQPAALWNHFADLNSVPRPSKKEERVIEFARKFGESLGLETFVDPVGNVIIRKPATPDCENAKPIVMQSHLDMVCQKNADTEFDFDSQGIDMYVDDDWVKARGTTLGADNGIGVAAIMAILSSTDISHPAVEALFTIDEETGMTGAIGLEEGLLHGEILLNLDTEEDNELTIGCAGGVDISLKTEYSQRPIDANDSLFRLSVKGLMGGHSGIDIHKGRGNANKLMNRLLWNLAREFDLKICEINGGGLRNAIPRESYSIVAVPKNKIEQVEAAIDQQRKQLTTEYSTTDPDLVVLWESEPGDYQAMAADKQAQLLSMLYICPNGIHRMSPDIEDLVQTSNNLARVLVQNGTLQIECLTRSSVNTERDDLANAITAGFQLLGDEIKLGGKYPGWTPLPSSQIVNLMSQLYEELFSEKAHVAACHAGLECGILGRNYPDMEMISFGPNIYGAHSPDERVQISSVQKFWRYLLEALKRIPTK